MRCLLSYQLLQSHSSSLTWFTPNTQYMLEPVPRVAKIPSMRMQPEQHDNTVLAWLLAADTLISLTYQHSQDQMQC